MQHTSFKFRKRTFAYVCAAKPSLIYVTKDSDQLANPRNLIRVFSLRLETCILGYLRSIQRELSSDCVDVQADLRPRWAHMSQRFTLSSFGLHIVVNTCRSHTLRQTVQILISWLLKKPADLDLHCFKR